MLIHFDRHAHTHNFGKPIHDGGMTTPHIRAPYRMCASLMTHERPRLKFPIRLQAQSMQKLPAKPNG